MIFICVNAAIQLAECLKFNLNSIKPEFEYLLPYGCKLYRDRNSNWFIKTYAWDESDWIRLSNDFPFLKVSIKPAINCYFDYDKHLQDMPVNPLVNSPFLK